MKNKTKELLENLARSNLVLNPQGNRRNLKVEIVNNICIIGPCRNEILNYELMPTLEAEIPVTKISSDIEWEKHRGEPVTKIELANGDEYRLDPTGIAFPEQQRYQSFCIDDYFTTGRER